MSGQSRPLKKKKRDDDGSAAREEGESDSETGVDWGVNAVMVGNGKTVESHTFLSGVRYATAGRPENRASYWPVQKSFITMPCFGDRLVEFSVVRVGRAEQEQDIPPFRVSHNK